MENTKYVTINDLRERWLNQQQKEQQNQQEQEQEQEVEDDLKPLQPSDLREPWLNQQQKEQQQQVEVEEDLMPKKYVTIVDLRERWLKQQKQAEEEEDRMKNSISCDGDEYAKSERNNAPFQNPNYHKFSENPNLINSRHPNWNNRRGFYGGGDQMNDSSQETEKIDCDGEFKGRRYWSDKNKRRNNKRIEAMEKGIPEKEGNYATEDDNSVEVMPNVVKEKENVLENGQIWNKVGRIRNGMEEIEEEKRFRAVNVNPNWNNRRPLNDAEDTKLWGGRKMSGSERKKRWKERKRIRELEDKNSTHYRAVKANDQVVIDGQAEFNDAQVVKDDHKKLRRDMRLKKLKENKKRNRLVNGETHNVVPEKRNLAVGKGTEVIEKRIVDKKISEVGVDDSIGDNVVEVNYISGLVMAKKAMGRTRNGVNDGMEEIEAKMKEVTVTEKRFQDSAQVEFDGQGELKDAVRFKKPGNRKRNPRVNGETHNLVPEKGNLALGKGSEVLDSGIVGKEADYEERLENRIVGKLVEHEEIESQNVSDKKEVTVSEKRFPVKGTSIVGQERWVPKSEAKMKEVKELEKGVSTTENGNVSKNDGYGEEGRNVVDMMHMEERIAEKEGNYTTEEGLDGENVVDVMHISGLVTTNVLETEKIWKKEMGRIRNGVKDGMEEIEGCNVVRERWVPKSEAKMKDVKALEKGVSATENGNVSKNDEYEEEEEEEEEGRNVERVGEVCWGDRRARGYRKMEVSVRGRWEEGEGGRKVYKTWNEGRVYSSEGNTDKGLIWVKKS